jgi:transposase
VLVTREVPPPWRPHIETAVALVDELTRHIDALERELGRLGTDHRYVALLVTIPGVAWVLGNTIAAEIGDVGRFPSPHHLTRYTGLCPRVCQSGERDRRGRLSKLGPRYLRWALLEAAIHACRHPVYRGRYLRMKRRLGKQRGAKVAQIDIARRLAAAIWHMLTREQPFAPAGARTPLVA